MPTYIVKPEKSPSVAPALGAIEKSKVRYPTVRVEVSPEIIRALEIGQEATVTLTGTIKMLSENRYSDDSRCDLELELRKVEAYPTGKKGKEEKGEEKPEKKDPKY